MIAIQQPRGKLRHIIANFKTDRQHFEYVSINLFQQQLYICPTRQKKTDRIIYVRSLSIQYDLRIRSIGRNLYRNHYKTQRIFQIIRNSSFIIHNYFVSLRPNSHFQANES